jgi:hypothetical protein
MAAIGLIAGAGATFLSSKSKNKAANKAADVTMTTSRENNALARELYGKNEGYLGPLAESAGPANALLSGAAGYGDQPGYRDAFRDFIRNSDYGFQFDEGTERINSGYAGNSMIRSGAAMKDIARFTDNLQSGYRGEFNSLLDSNRAFGLGAGSALAGVGQNYVGTVSANNNNAGEAQANALLYKGANNPLAGALGMVGGGLYGMQGMKF